MIRPRVFLGLGLSLLALVAGGDATYADQEVRVALRDFRIEPASISARAGETVRFVITNAGQEEHDFRSDVAGVRVEGIPGFPNNLQPGQVVTVEYTFDTPGSYRTWCPVDDHEDRGMQGTLTVLAAARAGGAPLAAAAAPLLGLGALLLGAGVLLWRRR